jgi:succinate dehydrogenase/fumarate reductase cytochrome b subunit
MGRENLLKNMGSTGEKYCNIYHSFNGIMEFFFVGGGGGGGFITRKPYSCVFKILFVYVKLWVQD